jgi:hypothetical protein
MAEIPFHDPRKGNDLPPPDTPFPLTPELPDIEPEPAKPEIPEPTGPEAPAIGP